jgi:hypothetical protein
LAAGKRSIPLGGTRAMEPQYSIFATHVRLFGGDPKVNPSNLIGPRPWQLQHQADLLAGEALSKNSIACPATVLELVLQISNFVDSMI